MTPIFGLDLGQRKDFSALVLNLQDWRGGVPRYRVAFIKRWKLGTPYPEIAADVKAITTDPRIDQGSATLVVDQTGVGVPVVEMVVSALTINVVPIWITGGSGWRHDKENRSYNVAKTLLVSCIGALLSSHRLEIVKSLREQPTLTSELDTFEVKVSKAANELYSAREGKHDDLVLATALTCWAGDNLHVGPWEYRPDPRGRTATSLAPRGVFLPEQREGDIHDFRED